MREDKGHYRNYGLLLRRIIVAAAVLAAVPVILWTITVFVRTYVGQPKLPTFRQLAATGTIALPRSASASADTERPMPIAGQSKLADASSAPVELSTADAGPPPPLLGDRSADSAAMVPAGGSKVADVWAGAPTAAAPANGANASAEAVPATDATAAAPPLAGPIPLPPRRPRFVAMAQMAQMAPARVPMPRPRPDAAGPATSDNATTGPVEWLQNMFHKSGE